ncbi:response regulator [Massilia sp. CCM 9210]|uniref:response regulator n=1 Tax=Massilia scottii TaxID=3057166 RepID=UPI002796BF0A|nr:response regulator [Massilia sp. CCM 9210]MDQ1815949.1 response regulator [Massilia sp. CCM 9210]
MAIFRTENLALFDRQHALSDARHTVMLVDDMDANVSVMAAILRPHFHLVEARDGQEALRLIGELPPSQELACIVSDHRMPRMSGVQLFERTSLMLPDTLRILVTAYLDLDAIVDAVNAGHIYRFIAKPFDAGGFLLAVQCAVAAFEHRRLLGAYHRALEDTLPVLPAAAAALREQARAAQTSLSALEERARAALPT